MIQMYQTKYVVFMCENKLFLVAHDGLLSSQLASVILKQYVETHWCSQSEKFRPPETTERVIVVLWLVYLQRCERQS